MYIIAGSHLKPSFKLIIEPQWSEHMKNPQDFPVTCVCFAWLKQPPDESHAFSLSFKYIKPDEEAKFFSWRRKLIHYNPQGKSWRSTDLSAGFIASFIPLKVNSLILSHQETSHWAGHVYRCKFHESHILKASTKIRAGYNYSRESLHNVYWLG